MQRFLQLVTTHLSATGATLFTMDKIHAAILSADRTLQEENASAPVQGEQAAGVDGAAPQPEVQPMPEPIKTALDELLDQPKESSGDAQGQQDGATEALPVVEGGVEKPQAEPSPGPARGRGGMFGRNRGR